MPAYPFRTAEATVPVAERAAEMRTEIERILRLKTSAEVSARIDHIIRGHLTDHETAVRRACARGLDAPRLQLDATSTRR
jgi:hypothetical protein